MAQSVFRFSELVFGREHTHLEIMQTENLRQRRTEREPLLARTLLVCDLDHDLLHGVQIDRAQPVHSIHIMT